MKLSILAIAALLLAPIPTAVAQTSDISAAGKRVYDWCRRSAQGSVSECSCVSGFYAGATEPDEFQMIAAMVDHIGPNGDVPDMNAMQAAMQAAKVNLKLTDTRYNELIQRFLKFEELGAKGDSICVPLKDHAATAQ